jgi:hypothetical protein
MTLSTQTSKTTYTGNGATRVFPVPFPFLRPDDIKVLLRQGGAELPLTIGGGSPSGGSLALVDRRPRARSCSSTATRPSYRRWTTWRTRPSRPKPTRPPSIC